MRNGSRPFSRFSLPRGGVARRVAVLLVTMAVATLVSPAARASNNHGAVPMCSSDGRSVIAPPIILPFRLVTLEAPVSCPHADVPLVQSVAEHHQPLPSNPPAPQAPRAVPVRAHDLARPASERLSIAAVGLPASREVIDNPYRPPRS
jgi:hypothetical protein